MPKMIRQTSFSGGQADEVTWKRTDVESYLSAAQSLLNCEVGTTGLAKKRKGTTRQAVVTSYATNESTMYEFIDKNNNYYLVLASNLKFTIYQTAKPIQDVVTYSSDYVVNYNGNQVVAGDNTGLYLVAEVVSPYVADDLYELDYTQDNDSIIFTSPKYQPGRLFISQYAAGLLPLAFAYQVLTIYPLPAYDFNKTNYNSATVGVSGTRTSGGTMTITFSNSPSFTLAANTYTNAWLGGQIVGAGVSDSSPIGYGIIQSVNNPAGSVTFTILVQVSFGSGTLSTVGSQYSIRQPAWVNSQGDPFGLGYPSHVFYFQNRLWFANTLLLPTTVFGSKINQPISFDVGTGSDVDAIIYTIGQTGSGEILWLNGGKQLEIYTRNYEFACPQDENVGLTPSTFSIRQQSSYGSSEILKPETYFNDSYFVQKTGKALINFHFEGVGLAYKATSIAPQSQGLMRNPESRALLRGTDTSQDNFLYLMNRGDNTITALQFSAEVGLAALTPITFENNVLLIDIVTVENHVYLLKYYTLTNTFVVDRMETGVYVDDAQSKAMTSAGVITGLNDLNGYSVTVLYANQDLGSHDVINGQVTVTNITEQPQAVQVGLLYDVEIKPMYPFYSSTSSPFFKQLSRVYVDYYESLNFLINGKLVQYQNFQEIQAGLPLVPKTDTAIFSPVSGYSRNDPESIVITQSSPFNLEILSIGYEIDMAVI